jgi:hypothetical protein
MTHEFLQIDEASLTALQNEDASGAVIRAHPGQSLKDEKCWIEHFSVDGIPVRVAH